MNLPANPPEILEAGCGTGGNLAMLSKLGRVKAFEHDYDALKMAREKGKYHLQQGTLPDGELNYTEPFDLVVAFDVIEHVEKDTESLKRLRSLLKSDGKIVITVPAFPFLWSRHDETHHHFRRYTRANLACVLKEAGFEVEYLSYFNSLLFPIIAGVRLAKKFLGFHGSDDGLTPSGANAVLQKVFSTERHWIGKVSVPFGVSLIAVAHNPS